MGLRAFYSQSLLYYLIIFILDNNKHLISFANKNDVSDILNRIHDIKHAFDLQKLEIKDYYSHEGNYFPRQKVDFFGV